MNVIRRDTILKDGDLVAADLSALTRAELDAIGIALEVAPLFFQELICRSFSSSYFDEEGNILCILGFSPEDDHLTSWFAGTQRMFDLGATGILATRRCVKEAMTRFPGRALESVSFSKHPEAPRWFRALGYVPTEVNDNFTRYRFKNTG